MLHPAFNVEHFFFGSAVATSFRQGSQVTTARVGDPTSILRTRALQLLLFHLGICWALWKLVFSASAEFQQKDQWAVVEKEHLNKYGWQIVFIIPVEG